MTAYDLRKLSQLFTPGDRCIFPLRPLQKPKEMGIGLYWMVLGAVPSVCVCMFPGFCAYHLWWFEFRSTVWYYNCICSFLRCFVVLEFASTRPTIHDNVYQCDMSYVLSIYGADMSRPIARSAPWDAPCLGMLQIVMLLLQLIFLGILLGNSQFQQLRSTRHHQIIFGSGLPTKRIKFGSHRFAVWGLSSQLSCCIAAVRRLHVQAFSRGWWRQRIVCSKRVRKYESMVPQATIKLL